MSGAVVIVGGGAAGLATARSYREAGGDGPVTILSAEAHPPYRRPPLTKGFLRGEEGEEALPLEPPDWYARAGVTLRLAVPVMAVDPERRVVTSAAGEEVPYRACVLATGSEPARPPVPGADGPDCLVMRTVEDARALAARLRPGARVCVVGAGFVGCEAAASAAMRGAAVDLVAAEASPQEPRLGPEAGARIAGWLREAGVCLHMGASVEAIVPHDGDGCRVRLAGGDEIAADCALLGTGISRRVELAEAIGLAEDGAVPVGPDMRTGRPEVLAVGDIAAALNLAAGRRLLVEHWGEALAMGEVAGRALTGAPAVWDRAPGFWSTIGERTLKLVAWGDGWDEARLVEDGERFAIWYGREGVTVGVLTHGRDEDYERGRALVERGRPLP